MQQKSQTSKFNIQIFALVCLLLLYLAVALAHAYLAPLTTGPDELAHYEYIRFIADHGRLPLDKAERGQASYKSDQPPLYHLLAAGPASLIDPAGPPFLKRVSDTPRRQLIERTRHAWGLYNTEDERWPYRAEVLRWHVARWVAILFGAATVAVTFFIARDFFTRPAGEEAEATGPGWLAALGAAAVVAFIPRFALTGAMVNYETTVAFFAALFLWVLLRIARGRPASQREVAKKIWQGFSVIFHPLLLAIFLGLFAGLAVTAKLSALILPVEIILALTLIGWFQGWSRLELWRRIGTALLATALAAGWWFIFVLYQFNTVAQDGWWVGLLRPLVAADASDATTNRLLQFLTGGQAGFGGQIENLEAGPVWEWAAIHIRTFWMVDIETVQPLAPAGLVIVLAACLLAGVGLALTWRSRRSDLGLRLAPRLALALLVLHLVLPLVLPLLRYAVTRSLADTAQGRHVLFLAAPALAVLWLWGLGELVTRVMAARQAAIFNQHPAHLAVSPLPPPSRFMPTVLHLTVLAPGLFLLAWTGVQLWTMTWAYLPLLPVRTTPKAIAQATHPLNRRLNEFMTLVGYDSQRDAGGRLLRVDLIWRATAVSPVDYLTEVSLLDERGQARAQWLGYPAGGRYPTRAWDVGDIIRDTIWLPLAGLEPGQYRLALNIRAANLYPSPEPVPLALDAPLNLETLTLAETPLRHFNGVLPFTELAAASAGFSVWQDGRELLAPGTFSYRETVLVTLSPLLPEQQRTVRLVSSSQPSVAEEEASPPSFEPVLELNDMALFIVGPDWPGGDYRLQVTVAGPGGEQQANSGTVLTLTDRWQRQYGRPEVSHPLEANFANQVKLLGYDLGTNRVAPGGGLPLTLVWQAVDWPEHDYTIFTKLLAADGSVHGGRDRLPQEGYRTIYWAPGEIVTDPFGVLVAADAPAGVYYLNVGLYKQVGNQAISLPLVENGQVIPQSSVNIGPIKVGGPPPGATLVHARPQTSLDQSFGDGANLTLLGYDLALPTASNPPAGFELTLYWRCNTPLPLDYTTFVHVRDAAGQTVAQKDQPPLGGAYPTSLWDAGEIMADKLTVSLPADLPAGSYSLVVGLYDLKTGLRLTVPGQPDNSLVLETVKVGR